MIEFTVTVKVQADVDGWAKASGTNAAGAMVDILAYLRETDPCKGQTYLTHAGTTAHMELNLGPINLD